MLNRITTLDLESKHTGPLLSLDPELQSLDLEMAKASSKLETLFTAQTVIKRHLNTKVEVSDLESMNDNSLMAIADSTIAVLQTTASVLDIEYNSFELESSMTSSKEKYEVAMQDLEGMLGNIGKKIKEWWKKFVETVKKWWNKLWGKDEKAKAKKDLSEMLDKIKELGTKEDVSIEDVKSVIVTPVMKLLVRLDKPNEVYNQALQLNAFPIAKLEGEIKDLNGIVKGFEEDKKKETYEKIAETYGKMQEFLYNNPGKSLVSIVGASYKLIFKNVSATNVYNFNVASADSKLKLTAGVLGTKPTFTASENGVTPKSFLVKAEKPSSQVVTAISDENMVKEFEAFMKKFKIEKFSDEVEAVFKALDEIKESAEKLIEETSKTEAKDDDNGIEQIKLAYAKDYQHIVGSNSAAIKSLIKF